MATASPAPAPAPAIHQERLGALLVFLSALSWSTGGLLQRYAAVSDPWVTVFWRLLISCVFLLAFMLLRDGPRGTVKLFAGMGMPGLAVGACFGISATSFVVALSYTTVANVVLIQAGVPLIAALMSWLIFRERVSPQAWAAIAAVIFGVGVMVSDSFTGAVAPIGDMLALTIAISFATATVITRRYAHIRMTPAVFTGGLMGFAVAAIIMASRQEALLVTPKQFGFIFLFGLTLALGMALFTTGARMIPSAFAALLGTAETVLGPIWVWLALDETPSARTLIGGGVLLAALIAYLLWQVGTGRRGQLNAPPAV